MVDAKRTEIRQWLMKARSDLNSATVLIDRGLNDTGVYHCQQVAEKALKAYLAFRDAPLMKVHDITALVKQCVVLDESFAGLMDMADILTPYATAFRYPGDVMEPEIADTLEALQLAGKILEYIEGKMPKAIMQDCK